jgi:hypothetical protein
MHLANERRLDCRSRAQGEFNKFLKQNGTPVDGEKDTYSLDRDSGNQARDIEFKAYADCQKQYEDDVQAARLNHSDER